jgi:NAD-dependent DNA ligase
MYDLCNLNKRPGQKVRKSISLEDLVRAHCPEDLHITKSHAALEKGVRTSNWEAWPLSEEQIEYAAKDAALGVMAFRHFFDKTGDKQQMSIEAAEALTDLETADSTNIAKKDSASKSKSKESVTENGEEAAAKAKKDASNQHFFQAMRNSILKPPNLGKKEHPSGDKNALAKVCIIVSGILDSFERSDLEKYVKEHGGSVSKAVSAKVTHLVTDHGEAGPSKLAKCTELGIPVVSEDVILKMVKDSKQ